METQQMANNFDYFGKELFRLIKKKQYGQLFLALAVLLVVLLAQHLLFTAEVQSGLNSANLLSSGNVTVYRVLDGDTFAYITPDGEQIVRLLGVNSPESNHPRKPVECFGRESSAYLENLLHGQNVRLEKDIQALNVDKYGRELRYAFLKDGRMINQLLLENGFALATPEYPFTLSAEFVKLEAEAKSAGKGLWSEKACQ